MLVETLSPNGVGRGYTVQINGVFEETYPQGSYLGIQ